MECMDQSVFAVNGDLVSAPAQCLGVSACDYIRQHTQYKVGTRPGRMIPYTLQRSVYLNGISPYACQSIKNGCSEGGCGACAVELLQYDKQTGEQYFF